jgi:GNAT superfamily N-acetyltransferase
MLTLRPASRDDVPTIRSLVRELAEFERELESCVLTEADLLRDGFGAEPYFHAVIAEWDREPVGLALYFFNYSTWQGRPGLYLEDLYVRPSHRGRGIGRALLQHVAQVAVDRSCGRLVWQVLDWNEKAIAFYRSLGAPVLKDWLTMRLAGDDIRRLARGGRQGGR